MKITVQQIIAAVLLGLGLVSSIILLASLGRAQPPLPPAAKIAERSGSVSKTGIAFKSAESHFQPAALSGTPPFILADTSSSSPDTNLVGNLVIFTADIGGTPAPALQWKVNKGGGFVDVPAATNSWLGITNAQIPDTGVYSLFATNSAGVVSSTARTITLIDGVD